jgi:hypothetical protein
MEGGEPNPEPRRNLIGKTPMFNYPTKQTPDPEAGPENHGLPGEGEAVGAALDPAAVKAARDKADKAAEAERKEWEKANPPPETKKD